MAPKITRLLWLILWYTLARVDAADNETSIAVKASFTPNVEPIVVAVESFQELLERSNVFVDKSLLIKQILQRYLRIIVLAYPRKWGKSVNLSMMKTFLEIEVDDQGSPIKPHSLTRNYRLFQYGEFYSSTGVEDNLQTPLLISREEDLLLEYQGEYPVIYANFKQMVTPGKDINIVQDVRDEITRIFVQHDYMKQVFNKTLSDENAENERKLDAKEKLIKFQQIIKQLVTVDETRDSLAFLCEILHEHFEKKVFVLIDDYDVPLNNTFFGVSDIPISIVKGYVHFYQRFLESSLNNEHVVRAVLTGTLPLAKELVLPKVNNFENNNIMFNGLYAFYGFSQNETDTLFERLEIAKPLREGFHARFHGYKVGVNSKMQIYDPLVVAQWLGRKKTINDMDEFTMRFFQIDSFRNAISAVISGLELPANITDINLEAKDIDHLRAMNKNENFFGPLTSSALKYFHATGYITLSEILYEQNICFRFPNDHVYGIVKKSLINYYEKKFSIQALTFLPVANLLQEKFAEFVNSTEHAPEKLSFWFKNAIRTLYKRHANATDEKENSVYSLFGYMLSLTDSYRRYPNYNPEIILFGDQLGVIVAATYNVGSAQKAVTKAENYVQLLKPFRFVKIKSVGIDVTSDMEVDIRGLDYTN